MEEIWKKMYEEAKKVLKERQISKYVLAFCIAIAIQFFVVYPLMLKVFSKVPIRLFFASIA